MNRDVESVLSIADRARGLDRMPAEEAQQALLEEILERGRPQRRQWPTRAGSRWVPVVAAAAVGALVVGTAVVLGSPDGDGSAPAASDDASADNGADSPRPSGDPGLPPTSDTLLHVVVNAPGWQVDGLSQSPYGSELFFEHGDQMLSLVTYPADQYDSYLQDRAEVGPESSTEALSQVGRSFTYEDSDPDMGPGAEEEQLTMEDRPEPGSGGVADPDQVDTRVATIFPVVGDWFLEIDATVGSAAEHRALLSSLQRVDAATWEQTLGEDIVLPSAGADFLAEIVEGVPLPPGLTVTPDQLDLPQERYQAAVAFVAAVSCGWFAEHEDGNPAATPALESSHDWQVLQWMDVEGDYPEVLWELTDRLDSGHVGDYWSALGCA